MSTDRFFYIYIYIYIYIYVTGTVHTVMLFVSSNFACARIHSLVMDADVSAPRLTNRERGIVELQKVRKLESSD